MITQNLRINQRMTQENTYCLLDDTDHQFEVIEISAKGFSFACDQKDKRFRVNVDLPDISIVNGEAQEIIHASGVIRHRSSFDSRRDRVGIAFSSKRFDNTITGRVRLPRHRPSLDLAVSLSLKGQTFQGRVGDYNVRSARMEMQEPLPFNLGDTVHVTMGSGTRCLFDGEARVLRSDEASSHVVVEFINHLLELRSITITEKAMYAAQIIQEKNASLHAYKEIPQDYKALISDWRMYLEMMNEVIQQEEAKHTLVTPEEQRLYLEELFPEFKAQMRQYIAQLNTMAPHIPSQLLSLHKELIFTRLEPFLRRSPLVSCIMDKPHGYLGDFETIKYFFDDPYMGSSLFGKLMNAFVTSLEAVTAHVDRIAYLHNQVLECYNQSSEGIRVLSLGSGPAEEILRMLHETPIEKPIHITLIDQDAHALADFYERVQPRLNSNIDINLINFNIINILVGKFPDLPPMSYDITYCAGMFDYFKDRLCRKFCDFMLSLTKEGGQYLYTNVHSRNFARYFMDYAGGWGIYHRNEEETAVLSPKELPKEVLTDETGTNVFVSVTQTAKAPQE
ncbi:MAG: hypothetical protein MI717_07950 [Spirochaetales bacterium]|nr:hypothetical protein [Spirochaetales bacterium]